MDHSSCLQCSNQDSASSFTSVSGYTGLSPLRMPAIFVSIVWLPFNGRCAIHSCIWFSRSYRALYMDWLLLCILLHQSQWWAFPTSLVLLVLLVFILLPLALSDDTWVLKLSSCDYPWPAKFVWVVGYRFFFCFATHYWCLNHNLSWHVDINKEWGIQV